MPSDPSPASDLGPPTRRPSGHASELASEPPSEPASEPASEWWPDTSSDDPAIADLSELASFYRYLADAEFDGYCDLYARIARAMADDTELLERIATLAPAAKVLPVLLYAAVHHLVLADPASSLAQIYAGAPGDPWPPFRAMVVDRFEELRELLSTRTIQTNEVGRSAVLLPSLTAVHRLTGRPLALVEIGPSAGLNLLLDRFAYRYDRLGAAALVAGDPASPVHITCEVRGALAPPLAPAAPPLASREGIDLQPVDVTDPVACRWLEACVWPMVPDRAERLRAAIGLARTDVPVVHCGNALDLLAATIDALAPDVVPCVFATWALAYFSQDDRLEVGRVLDRMGGIRDVALITGEYPSIAPFIDRPEREPSGADGSGASLLGLSTWIGGARSSRPLAWTHAHGRWIDWLDEPTSDGPFRHGTSARVHSQM